MMGRANSIEDILNHEAQMIGRDVTYYNGHKTEYVDEDGKRQALWLIIYEAETEAALQDLGYPQTVKRWVVHDTGRIGSWWGGIVGA